MMDYEAFKEYIRKRVFEAYEGKASVEIRRCVKNNGLALDGITIFEKELNVSPTIYLEEYYNAYRNGEDPDKLAGRVLAAYRRNRLDHSLSADFFSDFERVKPCIRRRLVSRRRNEEFLKNLPFEPYLDLAVIWYIDLLEDIIPNATVLVHRTEMERWGVNKEILSETAARNMAEYEPAMLRPMQEVLKELKAELREISRKAMLPYDLEEETLDAACPMYVLTTRGKTFGSAAILDTEVIRKLSEEYGEDIYILPSSIHEAILVPANEQLDRYAMYEMIREINLKEVAPSEVLSSSLYRYDRAIGEIVIDMIEQ
ncbi:MAG: DUF5688 family protein [Lachnospiraceae bacterium]|nr:DUF5688 family protein [Lachnospiraceae bacterium]